MNPNIDVAALLSPPEILRCKKVLCIQPHPDDIEIGMGGIVALLAEKGCEIHYLTVTDGDQGRKDPAISPEETAAIRRREAEAAGKHLGASHFHFFHLGDGTLSEVLPLSAKIAHLIREIRPQAVFAPDPFLPYECHWDHIITGRAAANGFLMSGRLTIPEEIPTQPFQPEALGFYFTARPNSVFDITHLFDKKFEAIALHESQMDPVTLAMYRIYFQQKGQELAEGKGFSLGEGLKVLSPLHLHCFPDADRI